MAKADAAKADRADRTRGMLPGQGWAVAWRCGECDKIHRDPVIAWHYDHNDELTAVTVTPTGETSWFVPGDAMNARLVPPGGWDWCSSEAFIPSTRPAK